MNILPYLAEGKEGGFWRQVANQLASRWEDCPGLSVWGQHNHMGPYGEEEAEEGEPERWQHERTRPTAAGFEEEGRGHERGLQAASPS